MTDDAPHKSGLVDAGEALAASAWRSRVADSELAAALHRPQPAGRSVTAGYLAELNRRPRLSDAQERHLVAAAQNGDARARAQLVEHYMPMIASVARLYRDSSRVDRVELLQEGVVGLLRALERFDPARGTPFWAYASWWVRQAMQQLVSELTRPVVLSDRALRQLAQLKDVHRRTLGESGREPTASELAAETGFDHEQVDHLLAVDRPPRSTDEPVAGEDGAIGTFGDLLVDPLSDQEYERVLGAIETEELLALLAGLSERERSIVRARYGLDGEERSLRDIAATLGLSAERVRQLEQRALGKLAAAAGVDGAA
jgi:RNA polymerase primary sigma factor